MKLPYIFRIPIGVLYINNDVAFGFRMYNPGRTAVLGFFVSDGTVEVKDAAVLTE